ncbi:MAG: helix-turn-helix transcriptional regulator [Candidatus Methanoplasma sp.]|jgi:putative molybdopterin biosynthesis protein|nr:helix-turn-helix transcriptional regulator [Candidatus Methanoplasma sp.]
MRDNKNSLGAEDVADILGISKNTVYKLVKRGDINSYRVGKKFRFTMDDIEGYIRSSRNMPPSGSRRSSDFAAADRSSDIVISGQDVMLDILSSYIERHEKGGMCLRSYAGSYDSLVNLYHGKVHVASSHLWDGDSGEYNISYVRRLVPGISSVIVHLTCRTQGLYVAEGNPKGIKTWADVSGPDVRMINREKGAGSRVLLDEHLRLLGISKKQVRGYDEESHSHLTVAAAVARGDADVGVGDMKAVSQVSGVDFIPLQKERYELVIREEMMHHPKVEAITEILRSKEFREEFIGLSGYDTRDMGRIVATIE